MQQKNLEALDDVQRILMDAERLSPINDGFLLVYAASHDLGKGTFCGSCYNGKQSSIVLALSKAFVKHPEFLEIIQKALEAYKHDFFLEIIRNEIKKEETDNLLGNILNSDDDV